jgi:hypothetical protein
MKIIRFIALAVVSTALSAAANAQSNRPIDAVKSFYAYDRTHSQFFSRGAIDARKKWFSDALYKLFLFELKRQREFLRKHPNEKTFFGEGLPFKPYDEICKVGRMDLHKEISFRPDAEDRDIATVLVIFAFPSPCKEPDKTEYTFQMIRSPAGWVIDNVNYGPDSNLVNDLKRKDY